MSECARYSREGVRCENRTEYPDRWCRLEGCEGFVRPKPSRQHFLPSDPVGFGKSMPSSVDSGQEVENRKRGHARVSLRASDLYKAHHGGSTADAVGSLRMLADWCVSHTDAITFVGWREFGRFSSDGFSLSVAVDSGTIVSYSAIHEDRTWAQVLAGVPSRASGKPRSGGNWIVDAEHPIEDHKKFLAGLTRGEVHKGSVAQIVKFGVFVRLGNALGLIHVSSYGPAESGGVPTDLEVGDVISVVIEEIDLERGRLSLSPDGIR